MSAIGLTVRKGNTLGLILGCDENTKEYDIEFEDGRRVKTAHVTWVPDYAKEADIALYRLSNRSGRLVFDERVGWDVISADDDLIPTDEGAHSYIQRHDNLDQIPQRDLDPSWGLEPDANTTFYPSNPDLEEDRSEGKMGPFFDVAPKPGNVDESYPSMITAANLERCPECQGIMTDAADHQSAHCQECGHTQPIDYIARRKASPLVPLELGEAAMGVGAAEEGSGAVSGLLNSADDLMSGAMSSTPGHGKDGMDQGAPTTEDADLQRFRQTQGAYNDPDDSTGANRNDGRDSDPENSDTNSYDGLNGPEVLDKNVDDEGGTGALRGAPDPIEAFKLLQPYLLRWNEHNESGADDPIVSGLDKALAEAYPDHYKPHVKSKVQRHEEFMEHVAARKPKMCPFHSDLVDYSLELGDPAAATAALSRHMYSPNSCKGGWAGADPRKPTKCRFKPQMIKQEYWDQKDAEAEQRRLEREQQGLEPIQEPIQDPNAITPEIPEDQESAVGDQYIPEQPIEPSPPGQEFQEIEQGHMVVQEIPDTSIDTTPADYVPETPADTAPVLVAARVATAADANGNPLIKGNVYEMYSGRADDIIPNIVEVTNVTPNNVQMVVKGAQGLTSQDSITTDQIQMEGITFRPHVHHPNAHGVPTDLVNNTDNTGYTGPGTPTDDLDSGANSHGAKTAGRDFSQLEQRRFINEAGRARNLHKLNLDGTHYVQEEDDLVIGM